MFKLFFTKEMDNQIIARNEAFGGIIFNQKNGSTLMLDKEGFKLVVKAAYKKELTNEEKSFLHRVIPNPSGQKIKFLFEPSIKTGESFLLTTHTPILIDLSLNNECNMQCPFCYMSAKPLGKGDIISMEDFNYLLLRMKEARVLQIALGGGEPTLHPNFTQILKKLRKEADIIPNYTTNGSNLTKEILVSSKKYCGAVAVSYNKSHFTQTLDAVKKLRQMNIKTNVHIVLLKENVPSLLDILKKYEKVDISGVVFLLFKPNGRGKTMRDQIITTKEEKTLIREFIEITAFCQSKNIALHFDACSAPFLRKMPFLPESIDGCNGSRYSCYVDWNLKAKPCSFMQEHNGVDLHEFNLLEAWNHDIFTGFRDTITHPRYKGCKECDFFTSCWGGCPIIPEIAVCSLERDNIKKI
ncbi:MAG: radical SAM protein [Candidatus Lokiarchaeota archaeon]|nr:radical SAM protein [Candidatus Lokiarchaeota archaeon]